MTARITPSQRKRGQRPWSTGQLNFALRCSLNAHEMKWAGHGEGSVASCLQYSVSDPI